jgi:hypothetical protein
MALLEKTMPEKAEYVISDEHYAALGQVAASWSLFEYTIDYCCWMVAGLRSDVGACFTSQIMGPAKKLDTLASLLNLYALPQVATALNKMGTTIRNLGDERNRALHDMWLADEETGEPHRFEISAKKTVTIKTIPVPTAALQDLSMRILKQHDAFDVVMDPVLAQLPTLPDTPEP